MILENISLKIVRALNQIVDMNQSSQSTLSFKFILTKIFPNNDKKIEFVSELRHSIIHKDFPVSSNLTRMISIVFIWIIEYFWRPLYKENISNYSENNLKLIQKHFIKAINIQNNKILEQLQNFMMNKETEFLKGFIIKDNLFSGKEFFECFEKLINQNNLKKNSSNQQNFLEESKKKSEDQKLKILKKIDLVLAIENIWLK